MIVSLEEKVKSLELTITILQNRISMLEARLLQVYQPNYQPYPGYNPWYQQPGNWPYPGYPTVWASGSVNKIETGYCGGETGDCY